MCSSMVSAFAALNWSGASVTIRLRGLVATGEGDLQAVFRVAVHLEPLAPCEETMGGAGSASAHAFLGRRNQLPMAVPVGARGDEIRQGGVVQDHHPLLIQEKMPRLGCSIAAGRACADFAG